jgi:outer membrane protein insertion porin family
MSLGGCLARAAFLGALALVVFVPYLAAQTAVIERIEIVGNRRIPRETLRSRIFSHEGDPYNEETLRRDFQALWNTQYFEDIRLEVEDSPDKPNAKVVIFYLKERPVIRRIKYKGNSSVSESDILDRYKERKVGLTVESQFDPTKIKRAEVVLKELLAEHGRQFATVKPTFSRIAGTNAVEVTFVIDEGPKVKVGKIIFVGNKAFSNRKIVRSMHNSRPYAIPLGITDVNVWNKTFDQRKLDEDLEAGIRALYQDNGYFQVLVKEPKLDTMDVARSGVPWFGSKHGKATNITIPIEEGDRFHMGKLVIRSADPDHPQLVFKTEFLEQAFPLKQGDIFSTEKVRKALADYRKLFGNFGFIDFTSTPITDPDTATRTVNLTLEFDQQKAYFVGRIEFVGNTTTRDKVIRREMLIDEGDLFSNQKWEISILRINQLDYFETIKAEQNAELKRNTKDSRVDITLKVKEKGKQSIGLNGGISGLAGSFIGLNYQTNNFLGLGERLNFSAQFGTLQRNFLFGFTEPYFRDKPLTTGFTIFDSKYSFNSSQQTAVLLGTNAFFNDPNATQNYNQNSKGFTVFASYPLKRLSFTRLGLSYGFTKTDISAFSQASQLLFESIQFRSVAGPSALNGIQQSQITATLTYNTVNNPINPTTGKSYYFAFSFVGGPLGGNVNTFSPTFEYKHFRPVNKKRNVLGHRLLVAYATGFGGKAIPPLSRFYMGGEDTVRGFNVQTITPVAFIPSMILQPVPFRDPRILDANGNPVLRSVTVPILTYQYSYTGGDIETVNNFEYRIPLIGPVSMSLFLDLGVVGILHRDQLQLDPAGLANLRSTFPSPQTVIPTNLGLATNSNFHPRASTGIEFVVQLPIVQVPFRIYYAYNVLRYYQVLQLPPGAFALSDAERAALGPAFNTQILPVLNALVNQNSRRLNYTEPLRTVRFTVSRTF